MEFNEYLKKWRLDNFYTQQDMADKARLTLTGYRFIESGQKKPRRTSFVKLCRVMKIAPEKLVDLLKE